MNVQFYEKYFLVLLVFGSSCYAHQGKVLDSQALVKEAHTACLRNDPAAARGLLLRQIRQASSGVDFDIAQISLRADSLCVALQSLTAAHSSSIRSDLDVDPL